MMDMDQTTVTEIATIAHGRDLAAHVERLLSKYVAGAIRPNRDLPVFELCRLLVKMGAELRADGDASTDVTDKCVARLLDPNPSGQLPSKKSALLAFGEFLMVHEDCTFFTEMREIICSLCQPVDADHLHRQVKSSVSTISKRLQGLRIGRFPVARHERNFQLICIFLFSRADQNRQHLNFSDDDILIYWQQRIGEHERVMFQTVVQQFLVFQKISAEVRQQSAVNNPTDLDAVLYQVDGGRLNDLGGNNNIYDTQNERDRFEHVLDFLNSDRPVGLKTLTGRERERLLGIFDCGSFMLTCPLTVLRRLSFGRVQSGISNYLRRGGGGPTVETRVKCGDAVCYSRQREDYQKLRSHGQRLMAILAHVLEATDQAPPNSLERHEFAAIAQRGRTELSKMSRSGFDQPISDIAKSLLSVTDEIVHLTQALDEFLSAIAQREAREDLEQAFEADRQIFSECLELAYVSSSTAAAGVSDNEH